MIFSLYLIECRLLVILLNKVLSSLLSDSLYLVSNQISDISDLSLSIKHQLSAQSNGSTILGMDCIKVVYHGKQITLFCFCTKNVASRLTRLWIFIYRDGQKTYHISSAILYVKAQLPIVIEKKASRSQMKASYQSMDSQLLMCFIFVRANYLVEVRTITTQQLEISCDRAQNWSLTDLSFSSLRTWISVIHKTCFLLDPYSQCLLFLLL